MTIRQVDLPRWSHYAIAVLLTLGVVLLRIAAAPILGDTGPFFLSSLVVLISAFIGGLWPGLFATVLTTASGAILFLGPSGADFSQPKTRIIVAAQITVCFCISLICGALRSSEKSAAAIAKEREGALGRLSSLFNSITDALLTLTPDRRIIAFNESAGRMFGLTDKEIGKTLGQSLPNAFAEALEKPLTHATASEDVLSLEVHDERSGRSYEVRGFPSAEGLLVYFHDITERLSNNEAIAALATTQERTNSLLDSLLTHAPLGFAFFDREGRCERVNGVLAEINGAPAADHLGKPIREVLPIDGVEVEKIIQDVFDTGQAKGQVEFAGQGSAQPGRTKYWHAGFYPVASPTGEVTSVGVIILEITQRILVEEKLRESESRFRNLADDAPMMIWICKPDGSATWFNRPWLEFRNETLEQAIKGGCFAGIHPEDENWVGANYRSAFRDGVPLALEYRMQNAFGEYRWLLVRANPIRDAGGTVDSYLVSSMDVTDRIHAEETMRKSLANERAARSDAERANRLKDEFLASLSHELRTPLTTMLGWTELLMRPHVRETELSDGLEIIHRSTKLQLQLINDLLDMSRISVGKLSLNLEFTELYDIVESVVHLIRPTASAKKIALRSEMPSEPIVVKVDTDRFTQILWNLLTNAIKFTPSGGQITVTVGSDEEWATVSVSDTGIGIEPEFLEFAFDRFRQEDGTRARLHGGMGLGLSIVKQLTELHGGTVSVSSEGKNRGACFVVTIPLANNLTPLPSAMEPEEELKIKVPKLRGACVLVVEDDRPSRELFRRMLEIEGATVVAATSAAEARKLMAETRPDVLVSDIGLPEEDGFSFLKNLRKSGEEGISNIPAIALTAFAGTEDQARAFEAGFQVFLAKPVDPEDLVSAVSQLKPAVGV